MNTRLLLLLTTIICALSCASCSYKYQTHGGRGALAKRETVYVMVHEDDSGDAESVRAIKHELSVRGFKVVEGNHAKLQVRLIDTWRWDFKMYLKQMELVFTDTKTGALKAHATFHNSYMHKYPNRTRVVQNLFYQLDQEGVFHR